MTAIHSDDGKRQNEAESYSEEETVRRREAALKRMLGTPPKPHKTEAVTGDGRKRGRPKRVSSE